MKRSILVTGGAGFIGSHIVDELISRGHTVRVLDNLDSQVHGKAQKKPAYLNPKAEFMKGDVRDRATLKKALSDIEVVFHEAAAVGVGQSMYQIEHYTSVNAMGAAMLLDEIVNGRHGVKRMIVASSMSIYGEGMYLCEDCGEILPDFRPAKQLEEHDWQMRCPKCGKEAKAIPTPETKPIRPTSVYAIGKRDHEEMFLSVGKAYGIPSVALRYFNVFGPRQSLSNPYTGVCAIFQSNIKNGNPPVIYEDGLQTRDFIDVKDIVQANMLALESPKTDYEMYNVGSGKPTSVLRIAETFARLYGKSIRPQIKNKYRAGDIRHCFADISKISKIGFKPKIGFVEGMMELVEWGKKQEALDMSQKALQELAEKEPVREVNLRESMKYSVIIPAHNEEDNIKPLADGLVRVLEGDYEIIFVDDNSKDGTADLCDNLAAANPKISCIHRKKGNNGMGYALIEGSQAAKGGYIIWVMGDRSDKLESIKDMLKKLDEGFDMVMASRYMSGGSRGELGVDKAVYGSTYTNLAQLVFGIPVHDITNAYRGFRRKILDTVRIDSGDFAISPELAIKAHLAGFRLGEVPTTYFDRRAGQTKFNILKMGLRYVSLFGLRLKSP